MTSRPVCQGLEGFGACRNVPSGWSESGRTTMQVVLVRSSPAKGVHATAGALPRGCHARPACSPSAGCRRPPRRRERSPPKLPTPARHPFSLEWPRSSRPLDRCTDRRRHGAQSPHLDRTRPEPEREAAPRHQKNRPTPRMKPSSASINTGEGTARGSAGPLVESNDLEGRMNAP